MGVEPARPVKVVHVLTDSNIGGAGRHLLALLDGYDRGCFKMEVILPPNARLIPELTRRGVSFTTAAFIAERSFSLRGAAELYKMFRRANPDIVHAHASLSARLAARLYRKGCRVVHTRHTVSPPGKYASRFPLRMLTGFINNTLSDVIVAVSPVARAHLIQTGARPEKIKLIYNGVPPAAPLTEEAKNAARREYGAAPGRLVVCQAARFAPAKGQDVVLDAAAGLAHENFIFLLAGDGPEHARITGRAAQENLGNVNLTGFVPEPSVLLNISFAQVNASTGGAEATSLALLEGMSLGVPAVVSDTGGNPYVIEHGVNGFVVPEKDPEALRAALLRLRGDKILYERLRAGALRRYKERFTAEIMVKNMEDMYKDLKRTGRNGR